MMLWFFLACPRQVSSELELIPHASVAPDPEPTDAAAWRRWVLHGDPLGRHPRLPAAAVDPQYSAWKALAAATSPSPEAWWFAERAATGTASVPLLRGARLAEIEALAGEGTASLPWVVPLGPNPTLVEHPRAPMAWLGADPSGTLAAAERSALLGWMDGPSIDVAAPAALLAEVGWARLAPMPAGAMVLGRAADTAPDPQAHALFALATRVALAEAVSDAAAMKAARAEALAALGLAPDAADAPRDLAAALLHRAFPGLAAAAHVDADAGLALVAHAALRSRNACDDRPCGGFDLAPELQAAARFGAEPTGAAAVWRVLAWDAAVDQLWAAWDRPQVSGGMDRVVQLAAAEAPGALDRSMLVRPAPDPGWSLAVIRALGGAEGTSKEALFRTLYGHVAELAHVAQAESPASRAALERIEKRARASAP